MNDTQKKALLLIGAVLVVLVLIFRGGSEAPKRGSDIPPERSGQFQRLDGIIDRSDAVLSQGDL